MLLHRFVLAAVTLLGSSTFGLGDDAKPESATKYFGTDPVSGLSQAVLVDNVPLYHTTQLFPVNARGELLAKAPAEQAHAVLKQLHRLLNLLYSRPLTDVVKLNVYVTNEEVTNAVRPVLAELFSGSRKPAVSFVQTRLNPPGVLVAMDAVAISTRLEGREDSTSVFLTRREPPKSALMAELPRGPRVYVSGQAEKGMNLTEATTKTMLGLKATLQHLGCDLKDVAQVKSFLTPMVDAAQAEDAIVAFFAPNPAPPLVFVEWQSSLPIEIEIIAAARPKPSPQEPLEFITPPGTTASPVFCRVVRVNDPRTIFVSGLHSRETADGAGQVSDVFDQLQEILKASGSDLRHLAKATYYVSDNEVSAKLNELRPKFYDPQRPPAASKAQVLGVGMSNRSLTLDMIAVPAK